MGKGIAAKIEGNRLKIWEGENHFALWGNHGEKIMQGILED